RAHAREPRREADTILPVSRWNWISASLFRVSCRQKTAEQNNYNWFSRIETVPIWFAVLACNCRGIQLLQNHGTELRDAARTQRQHHVAGLGERGNRGHGIGKRG